MMNRILITGAAGQLGSMLREKLRGKANILRLSDVADLAGAREGEEVVQCDLADARAVADLVKGCDGIVHLGGISVERNFDLIESANLRGVYNLYEAARAHGMPRILFASTNHTIGYHLQTERLDHRSPYRPDGLYGASKIFGEAIASLYYDKFGQETALVRIGSCTPQPKDWRMLATWLSEDDFVSLIETVFHAPRLGCTMVWGASANDNSWWDNSHASFLGWVPRDNSAAWAEHIAKTVPLPGPDEAVAKYQGGVFTDNPIFKD